MTRYGIWASKSSEFGALIEPAQFQREQRLPQLLAIQQEKCLYFRTSAKRAVRSLLRNDPELPVFSACILLVAGFAG